MRLSTGFYFKDKEKTALGLKQGNDKLSFTVLMDHSDLSVAMAFQERCVEARRTVWRIQPLPRQETVVLAKAVEVDRQRLSGYAGSILKSEPTGLANRLNFSVGRGKGG